MTIPVRLVHWRRCYRIIPSRFPTIQLFERITNPQELDAVIEVENLTNQRLRQQIGQIHLVPPEERICGPGTSTLMAAFTHINPLGSRFSNGKFGVFYAANDIEVAVAETKYHREKFMRATAQPAMDIDMRVYTLEVKGQLHDIRGWQDTHSELYDPENYESSRRLGYELRNKQSWGIIYHSVRHPRGECVAIFRPKALMNCRQERHLCYQWDGQNITFVFEKKILNA